MTDTLQAFIVSKAAYTDEFDRLRDKWKEMLTGSILPDSFDPKFKSITDAITAKAQSHWDSLNRACDREYLWAELGSTSISAHITANYRRLRDMAIASKTICCPLFNNKDLIEDIISALDWMYLYRYNENIQMYNNWWDWDIGAPLALNDITVLLYYDLSPGQIRNYMDSVDHFEPEVSRGGANRIWDCTVVGLRGVIIKDGDKIASARDGMSNVFKYVTGGEGFYSDGSFIQHDIHPYTGGYGQNLLYDMANVMYLLCDSEWRVTDPNASNVFTWVYDSFEPLMYRGAMMDMCRGRCISRHNWQDHVTGHDVTEAVIRLSQLAPEPHASNFKRMVKEWIQSDTYLYFYDDTSLNMAVLAKEIEDDENIIPRGELIKNRQFNQMARTVHFRPGFALGISMYSSRVANYESINGENLRGWYTGAGATYLYNSDTAQYSDNFWPTVNSFRIPGTTVLNGIEAPESRLSCHSWVGGTNILGLYGITGMAYRQEDNTLEARKSWFMFDDEIVALGAGVTSEDGINAETIIENRKINDAADNALTVDGIRKSLSIGWSEDMHGVKWIHLQGNTSGSDIGYYFPDKQNVTGLREQRTDTWSSINLSEFTDSVAYTRNFLALWFDHGINPNNESYSYVILPNKTAEEVGRYAISPDITILENSGAAQGVKENKLSITGVNFWIGGSRVGGIWCDGKASVMMQETDGELGFSLAAPTFSQTGIINIEIDRSAELVTERSREITVDLLKPVIRLSVDISNLRGRIAVARFKYKILS